MRNGSLLMTSRLQAKTPNHYRPYPDNTTGPLDKQNKRRAFARSDDGGHTWAELWYLADRQPEIARYTSECAHGITSDPTTGELFWAHPGGGVDGHDRSNGTLQRSSNGGAEWEFAAHIGPETMGYGYGAKHNNSQIKPTILPRQAQDKQTYNEKLTRTSVIVVFFACT